MTYYPTSKQNLILSSLLLLKQVCSSQGATRFDFVRLKNYFHAGSLMAAGSNTRKQLAIGKSVLNERLLAGSFSLTPTQKECIETAVDTVCLVYDNVNDRRFAKCLSIAERQLARNAI